MSVLHVDRRESGSPEKLRRKGLLPMALVERNRTTTLIQASEVDLRRAMAAADGLGRLDLEIQGEKKPRKVLVKQVDRNFVKQQILCVTLVEVSADDVVRIDIPVVGINHREEFEGQGLSFLQSMDAVKVRGKMSDLVERIEVDLSGLEVGHHISAGDLVLPEGVDLLSSPDSTIFSLSHLKIASIETEADVEAAEEAAEAEAAAAEGGESTEEESS